MSSINPNNIDGTYPIAGQDNDSQGFRDNFTNIKNNFTFAYDELTDLQSKVVLKSSLSGSTLSNDMSYAQLISPQLLKAVETENDLGTKTGSFTISWADAHFQRFTTSGNCTLAFSDWPTSGYFTKLRLQVTADAAGRTITFPAAVSVGLNTVPATSGQVVTLPAAGVYTYELTTYDAGTTIAIEEVYTNHKRDAYELYAPTANVSVTANVGTQRLHFTPTGTIVSFGAIVNLPTSNVDATTVSISSNVAVAQLEVSPNSGTTLDPSGNISLSAGAKAEFFFYASESKWYRVG